LLLRLEIKDLKKTMDFLSPYLQDFNQYLNTHLLKQDPENLYNPILYIMDAEGKRIRPVLSMMACEMFSEDYKKALPVGLALEVFHNFTLVHDDIMDNADLRRGKESVHIKYDIPTAILSGDAMVMLSFKYLMEADLPSDKAVNLFNTMTQTGITLCEGQQMDVDFESRLDVSIDEYLRMIEGKTAVLLGAALKMGGIAGGASEAYAEHLYQFGKNIGIAFQIQDDILDVFGNNEKVGKVKAGDIINNKKTYLFIKALELGSSLQKSLLIEAYSSYPDDPDDKVEKVLDIFNQLAVREYASQLKEAYLDLGKSHLDAISIDKSKKENLIKLADYLIARES
jgi:geranylgeranyl diphosphate synthase type II